MNNRHPFAAAVAVAVCVLALPMLCLYIEYNTQYTAKGEVSPALSYRIEGGLRLTDAEGALIAPVPSRTARALQVLLPAWGRLTAALYDRLLAIAADLWDVLPP